MSSHPPAGTASTGAAAAAAAAPGVPSKDGPVPADTRRQLPAPSLPRRPAPYSVPLPHTNNGNGANNITNIHPRHNNGNGNINPIHPSSSDSVNSNNGGGTNHPTPFPHVMGPPPIRPQSGGLYPSQTQSQPSLLRHTVSPTPPASGLAPPPLAPAAIITQDDRPQGAEQLQDALASAGVDLKAEEYNLSQTLAPSHPRPLVVPPTYGGGLTLQQQLDEGKLVFNRFTLSRFVDRIVAKQYNIPRIDNDVIVLLSLTLEHRLRQLISQMCLLARHRTSPLPPALRHSSLHTKSTPTGTPTLLDLARAERQKEEAFQSRKRARQTDKEGPPEKRPASSATTKPPGQTSSKGSRSKAISTELASEAQKRSTDTTVNVMLGGGRKKRYSWMDTPAASTTSAPSSPGAASSPVVSQGTINREDEKLQGRTVERTGWVTMKDALEALENDAGGENGIGLSWNAGGKALWRGWARIKD